MKSFLLLLMLVVCAVFSQEEEMPELSAEQQEMMSKMMNGGGGGDQSDRRFTRDVPYVEEDVPYVQCETCLALVQHIASLVDKRRTTFAKTKLREHDVLKMIQGVCDPMHENGEWITQIDVDDDMKLRQMDSQGYCEEECKTMAKACQNVVDEADSEIVELVFLGKKEPEKIVCFKYINGLEGACGRTALPVRVDRVRNGDNFRPKSEIDIALAQASRDVRNMQEKDPNMFMRDEV